MLNVYLCATPFHLLSAAVIRDHRARSEPGGRHLLVSTSGRALPAWVDGAWDAAVAPADDTTDVAPSRASRFGGKQRRKARLAASAAAAVTREVDQAAGGVNFHFAHLEDYLANHCFFAPSLARRGDYFVLPDGALNYYHVATNAKRIPAHLGKAAHAAGAGLTYRPFVGLLSGLDRRRVTAQFAMSDRVVRSDKAVVIDAALWRERMSGSTTRHLQSAPHQPGDGVLLIGQEAEIYHIGFDRYAGIWKELATEMVRRHRGPFYYKPHHDWPDPAPIVAELSKIIPELTVISGSERPVEMLIGEYGIRTVVSVLSSALLHCKLVYGSGVDAVSVSYSKVAKHYRWSGVDADLAGLRRVYEDVGVEMLEF